VPGLLSVLARQVSAVESVRVSDPFLHTTDQQLMQAVQRGRSECFAPLVDRHQGALLRVAESRLGRRDWAEDVVQETLLCAFRSRMSFDPTRSLRAWLWAIFFNQCRQHYRREQTRQTKLPAVTGGDSSGRSGTSSATASSLKPDLLVDDQPTPQGVLLAKERAAVLAAVLGQLPVKEADALRLRFYGELKFREIAEAMDCSLPTAKNRVKNGLLRMSELLAQGDRHQRSPESTALPASLLSSKREMP